MKGRYPEILAHPLMGAPATDLFADAQAMLDRIEAEGWLTPRAVVGIFPANQVGDEIELYTDATRTVLAATLPTRRQRVQKSGDKPHLALADFIAPKGIPDWMGAFVVTAGHGVAERVAVYKSEGDDYNAILLEALADRFAEASAEYHHLLLRQELWAYAPKESLESTALIAESYTGIRPAPGYPACPDHTQKRMLFALLDAETTTGASLTETCAIDPAASVAGWYFAHPQARYFGVGKTGV
jgi:5-methyltetrahydrofolate--homocysteine methyltransferase